MAEFNRLMMPLERPAANVLKSRIFSLTDRPQLLVSEFRSLSHTRARCRRPCTTGLSMAGLCSYPSPSAGRPRPRALHAWHDPRVNVALGISRCSCFDRASLRS